MFRDIPEALTLRMAELEETDTRDRVDGTQHLRRLRQIPPETGRFLALLAASAPDGDWIEIGTSAGYSTMWLSLACRARGRVLTTYEILEEKAQLATQTIATAMIDDVRRPRLVKFAHFSRQLLYMWMRSAKYDEGTRGFPSVLTWLAPCRNFFSAGAQVRNCTFQSRFAVAHPARSRTWR